MYVGLFPIKSCVRDQTSSHWCGATQPTPTPPTLLGLSAGVMLKIGRLVPAQVSSSSDCEKGKSRMARDQGKKLVVELPECDALIVSFRSRTGAILGIVNPGQMTTATPKLAPLSLNFSAIRGGRLSHGADSTYTMSTYTKDL
ncbi:hypothetical protein AVEN_263049-1 [Araneus ventricosus]|uniref:Uncharacterized protein n=1 Tax=Araneus ventricosus TaxID=182803 RepID=A0A4Y2IBV0_ARAVE|nr:hypothetical protein AVEN_263049-1 [Araneus ventricosus]